MWSYPVALSADVTEPVTLEQAKSQCRVDWVDDDALLGRLISAARDYVEKYCGLSFAKQQLKTTAPSFAAMAVLPFSPVRDLVSVTYFDTDNIEQVLDPEVYELISDPFSSTVVLCHQQRWPLICPGSRVSVIANVGYDIVPQAVSHAILLFVADAYHQRENSKVGDWSVIDALLCNYRRFS